VADTEIEDAIANGTFEFTEETDDDDDDDDEDDNKKKFPILGVVVGVLISLMIFIGIKCCMQKKNE